jgi:hypothetical protein
VGLFPDERQIVDGDNGSVLSERCRTEDRVLMTLDLDFANVQAYHPKSHLAMHSPIADDA